MITRSIALLVLVASVGNACAAAPAHANPSTSEPTARAASPSAASTPRTSATSDGRVLIQLAEHYFDPSSIVVAVGTTVLWRNAGQQTHDIHAYDGSFNSPPLGPGETYVFTFTKPGLYRYYCIPHEGDGMIGQVEVR